MGTDIHLFTERRINGAWEPFVVRTKCDYCDGVGKRPRHDAPGLLKRLTSDLNCESITLEPEDCYWCRGTGREPGYRNRNYDVFAMLAGVRNGRGFAGCDLGDGFVPVAEPRGLPGDMSEPLRKLFHDAKEADGDEFDALYDKAKADFGAFPGEHTPSWLSLRELLDYDLNQVTRMRGVVTVAAYAAWAETAPRKAPANYCGDVMGERILIADLSLLKEPPPLAFDPSVTHVKVAWHETYREAGGCFFSVFVPELAKHGAPDDVRIVFNFDS